MFWKLWKIFVLFAASEIEFFSSELSICFRKASCFDWKVGDIVIYLILFIYYIRTEKKQYPNHVISFTFVMINSYNTDCGSNSSSSKNYSNDNNYNDKGYNNHNDYNNDDDADEMTVMRIRIRCLKS